MKPRRRTILKVLILLIAGATLNVVVAWGLALWTPLDDFHFPDPVAVEAAWPAPVPADWQPVPEIVEATHRLGVSSLKAWSAEQADLIRQFQWTYHYGWPIRSMCVISLEQQNPWFPGKPPQRGVAVPTWIPWQPPSWERALIPTHVIWPGFAVNTLFYAGVLWVLCCGPFALRRMIRRQRGRCAACNYPIGQSPVCTECGAAVTPKASTAVPR